MLAKILWYAFFLLAFVGYLVLAGLNQQRWAHSLTDSNRSIFSAQQFNIGLSLVPLIVFPWILTGFFDSSFLLLTLLAAEVGALLAYLLFFLVQATPKAISMQSVLSTYGVVRRRPWLLLGFYGLGLLFVLGYLGYASYIFFSFGGRTLDAVREVFTMNLVLFVVGTFLHICLIIGQIASPNVDDPTRHALFFTALFSALTTGVFLTVLVSLTGISPEAFALHAFGFDLGPFVPTVGLLSAYLLIMVLPYLFGLERRRRREADTYRKMREWAVRTIAVVEIPGQSDPDQLAQLRDAATEEADSLLASDPVAQAGLQIELAGDPAYLPVELQTLVEPYRAFRETDLRFLYLNFLRSFLDKVNEMSEEYVRASAQANWMDTYSRLATVYGGHFRDERQQFEKRLEEAQKRKVAAPLARALLAGATSVPAVVKYGGLLLDLIPQ